MVAADMETVGDIVHVVEASRPTSDGDRPRRRLLRDKEEKEGEDDEQGAPGPEGGTGMRWLTWRCSSTLVSKAA